MARGRAWTKSEIDRLIEMRECRRMTWAAIARKLERTGTGQNGIDACRVAYGYHKGKRTREAAMIAAGMTPASRKRIRLPADDAPVDLPPSQAARLSKRDARPRYFHDAGIDIRARIAEQGLTAGMFGDPKPGRSALDQREARK